MHETHRNRTTRHTKTTFSNKNRISAPLQGRTAPRTPEPAKGVRGISSLPKFTKYKGTQATEQSGVRTTKYVLRSTESGVRSAESGVRTPEYGVRSPESRVRSPEYALRSTESGVRSPESGVRTPKTVGFPESGVRSPDSAWSCAELEL